MRNTLQLLRGTVTVAIFGFTAISAVAGTQIVTQLEPSTSITNVSGGWSYSSYVTPDGRYAVFSSTSDNLVAGPGGMPLEESYPPSVNVFIRDRQTGATKIVSLNAAGVAGGNLDSFPCGVSSNGQVVIFQSKATDLIAGNTNTNTIMNLYVRDVVRNITALVSVSTNGGIGNGDSHDGAITPDGRYVAFSSAASNLINNDTNGIPDIFVRDLKLGVTTLASSGAQRGTNTTPFSAGWTSECPIISVDGRYVAFYSTAVGLVSNVSSAGELYVRDLVQGTTAWVSAGAHKIDASAVTANYAMSTNGQWIAFQSTAGTLGGLVFRYNVVSGNYDDISTNGAVEAMLDPDSRNIDISGDGTFVVFTIMNSNGGASIQRWNGVGGVTSLISGGTKGAYCDFPRLDQSGRYVAFISNESALTTNSDGLEHIYVRDMLTGLVQMADVIPYGVMPISYIMVPFHFSAVGNAVAFECMGGSLNTNPYQNDAFVRDLESNITEIISAPLPSMPTITPLNASSITGSSVSSNGQYVAFATDSDGLASIDTNVAIDIYVHDLNSGSNLLVSVSADGLSAGEESSYAPVISGNGRYVVFLSWATNLIANDTNNATDIFERDLQTGKTLAVSDDVTGTGVGNAASSSPQISYDGQRVLFFSKSQNLTSNTVGNFQNLFWRDMQQGVTYALTTNGSYSPAAMSPDGSNVVFSTDTGYGISAQYSLWKAQTHTVTALKISGSTPVNFAVSANGHWAMIQTPPPFSPLTIGTNYVFDLVALTNFTLPNYAGTLQTHFQFSTDGQYLAYVSHDSLGTNQMYLHDASTGKSVLVSKAYNSSAGGNGACDSPAISANGRYVAYRSAASNLVPGDSNGLPDVFLYDSVIGGTTLISASALGPRSANARSRAPFFSGDGSTLFFETWASDIVPGDSNQSSDVYAVSLSANGFAGGTNGAPPPNFTGIFLSGVNGQPSTNQPITLTWTANMGAGYQVQFKTNLTDPQWQGLSNSAAVVGNQGSVIDPSTNVGQRFYRIISF